MKLVLSDLDRVILSGLPGPIEKIVDHVARKYPRRVDVGSIYNSIDVLTRRGFVEYETVQQGDQFVKIYSRGSNG